jgi:hypothetical protein
MAKKQRYSAFDFAANIGLASMHTGITLWHRLPMLAAASGGGSGHAPEMTRMVSEKTSAMIEGMFDAQKEMMRLCAAAATGRLEFTDVAEAAGSIAEAGLKPAFRRVKANSRRLSRKP